MISRIIFILFTCIFLFSYTGSIVDADEAKGTLNVENVPGRTDTVAQTIKITQDMKGWIATHFDPNVRGEYLSVSELEDQKDRFFLNVLYGNGKVLRRMVKSSAEAKQILKEINDGVLLINYIDKTIDEHRGIINKSSTYNSNKDADVGTGQKLSKPEEINKTRSFVPSTIDQSKMNVVNQNNEYPKKAEQTIATATGKRVEASRQQTPQSKTQRETVANDTTENNKDKTPEKVRTQTNKPETKITDTKSELARKAEAGDAVAQYNMGYLYYIGKGGVLKNYEKSAKWMRKAAEQGHTVAQNILGSMYLRGEGVTQNNAEAVKWYRKAAEHGVASAQFSLGYMYYNGDGVPKDVNEAGKWYRKAAEQGNANAQFSLGYMYYNGNGVPRDVNEADKWYRKAAEQGDAMAQYNLGTMYIEGEGVAKNFNEADKWYRKAAEQGHEGAKEQLEQIKK